MYNDSCAAAQNWPIYYVCLTTKPPCSIWDTGSGTTQVPNGGSYRLRCITITQRLSSHPSQYPHPSRVPRPRRQYHDWEKGDAKGSRNQKRHEVKEGYEVFLRMSLSLPLALFLSLTLYQVTHYPTTLLSFSLSFYLLSTSPSPSTTTSFSLLLI